MTRALQVVAMAVLLCVSAPAQTSGTIAGNVLDPSGDRHSDKHRYGVCADRGIQRIGRLSFDADARWHLHGGVLRPHFVLLNVDTLVTSGWIGRLLRPFQYGGSIGMVCPVTNFAGNEVKINATYSNEEEMHRFSGQLAVRKKGEVMEISTAPLFCALLSRAIWQDVGELDERFSVGMFEDDDYSVRLRNAGYRILTVEDCFVHHFGQGAFGKLSPGFYEQVFEQNQKRFESKWGLKWEPHRTRPGVRPAFEEKRFTPEEFLRP